MNSIISIAGVSKSYSGHAALKNIDLEIPSQGIFGLLGPNGAGKTTLIRILTQIIRPDSGNLFYKGVPLYEGHAAYIGYLPEERGLYKKMKAEEQLIYLGRLKDLTLAEAKTRTRTWLKKLGMEAWKDKTIGELSKGMQQKIQFIAAVLHGPELIILDEPFSGFDPINSELITNEILAMKSEGRSIVFSTHRMETVESLCDHIVLIHQGENILAGDLRTVKQQFKKNIFRLEGKGVLAQSSEVYTVVSQEVHKDGTISAQLKIAPGCEPNQLLVALMQQVQVRSFMEELPSMHEIFISQVNNQPA